MQKICNTCKAPLEATDDFCPHCGATTTNHYRYSGAASSDPTEAGKSSFRPEQKAYTEYGKEPYALSEHYPYEPSDPYQSVAPPRPKRPLLIMSVISGIILLLAVLGGSEYLLLRGSSGDSGLKSAQSPAPGAKNQSAPSPTPASACGGAFSDTFHRKVDNRWIWVNSNNDATYTITSSGLRLSTMPTSDLHPPNVNAARLMQSLSGNFTLDTVVHLNSTVSFQGAGFVIWQDQNNFLRFELARLDQRGILFEQNVNSTYTIIGQLDQHPTPSQSVELRLQKTNDHFTALWRVPGQPWQEEGETDIHFDSILGGVDVLATAGAPQTIAQYDYFRVSCG